MSHSRVPVGEEGSNFLRHYQSTPHLERTLSNNSNKSTVLMNASNSNVNHMSTSYFPKTTLSTFASHKSKPDVRYKDDPNPYKVSDIAEYKIQVQDPYVPKALHRSQHTLVLYSDDTDGDYVSQGMSADSQSLSKSSASSGVQYDIAMLSVYPSGVHRSQTMKSGGSYKSQRTGRSSRISGSVSMSSNGDDADCDIPEPDYEGSTVGSAEDIPIPIPESSCSEEYSSVSAGSDPDHYALGGGSSGQSPSPDIHHEPRQDSDSGVDTPTKISDKDRKKIECALSGRKTTVFVADSLANLYVMKKSSSKSDANKTADDWALKYTGVPVLLLDLGETKSRDKRRIQIVMAELGSGLALWKDIIDNLTSYSVMEESRTFHTMHLSSDHTKIVGLSFDDEDSAVAFSQKVEKLTSDFANISLSGSKSKGKKKDKIIPKASRFSKFVKPKKSEISQPCCFQHVSSLTSNDSSRINSLQKFVANTE